MSHLGCRIWRGLTERICRIISRPSSTSHGRIESVDYTGPGEPHVNRRLLSDLDRFSTSSLILTEESVFGDMFLVEASRGCQWGCRFCAAGFMYRPIRYRSPGKIMAEAARGLQERKVIGLVGAEMASVPGVADIATAVADAGGRLSPSSLKADCVSPELAAALVRSGARSVTVAPEAGSERMRKVINKNLTEAEILNAAEMLIGGGVESLKLYFMIGLPEERDEDLLEIANLTGRILERARARQASASATSPSRSIRSSPSRGRPSNGIRWRMRRASSARSRCCARLSDASAAPASNSTRSRRARPISRRWCRAEIGASDRFSNGSANAVVTMPGAIWHELRTIKREVGEGATTLPDPDFYVTRQYVHDEVLPWDFIDHHIHKWFLLSERKKAHYEHQTKPCDVTRCIVCGAC